MRIDDCACLREAAPAEAGNADFKILKRAWIKAQKA
jgi:hypothetical protein